MTRARCSFEHAEHGPITYPLTRIAWPFFFGAPATAIRGSRVLVLDLLPALVPVDREVAAEVAIGAHVVEDRIVPMRVLHEIHLLAAALLARVALLADAGATEHRGDTRSRFT